MNLGRNRHKYGIKLVNWNCVVIEYVLMHYALGKRELNAKITSSIREAAKKKKVHPLVAGPLRPFFHPTIFGLK